MGNLARKEIREDLHTGVTFSDRGRVCPYCRTEQRIRSADLNEHERTVECHTCGKWYHACESVAVSYYARPDCEINRQDHEWADRPSKCRNELRRFCVKCGAPALPESGLIVSAHLHEGDDGNA